MKNETQIILKKLLFNFLFQIHECKKDFIDLDIQNIGCTIWNIFIIMKLK